jgi:Tfp pilus assembly protein PilV
MRSLSKNQRGFSIVETTLLVVVVVAIGVVGWYVYSHRNKTVATTPASSTSTTTDTTATSPTTKPLASGTSNSDLQSDLSNVTNSSNQSNSDLTTTNNGLNDQSTFTSVPQ